MFTRTDLILLLVQDDIRRLKRDYAEYSIGDLQDECERRRVLEPTGVDQFGRRDDVGEPTAFDLAKWISSRTIMEEPPPWMER